MVAIHVPQYEPDDWYEPLEDDPRRGLDVGRWPDPPVPPALLDPAKRLRRLPDRATRVRRRRLALVLVVALAAFASIGLLRMTQGNAVGTDEAPHPITQSEYIVQPGDTFWTIAQRVAPDKDPRP